MSSDESDSEETTSADGLQFRVLSPRWRSQELTFWLRGFDAVHMIRRKSGEGPSGSRGAYPRLRAYSSGRKSSAKTFVRDLPINAYDKRWLASQSNVKVSVTPENVLYEFTHAPEVLE